MVYYTALDVSLRSVSICIIDYYHTNSAQRLVLTCACKESG